MSFDATLESSGGAASGLTEGVGGREIEAAARRRDRVGRPRLRQVGVGLLGGLVATVAMTAFRMPISDSLPPTADFWAKYVSGDDPGAHLLAGLFLHLAYGMAAGVVFALASPVLEGRREVEREQRGVLLGVAYGFLLSVFGERVLLEGLLEMDLAPDERFVFHVGHVVYGLTLGTWAGSKVGWTGRT